MNDAISGDVEDRNCFAETGYVRPAMGIGKDIPLFGMAPNSYAGTSCAAGSNQNCAGGYGGTGEYDGLTDGDLIGSSGAPTAYQECCTHGYMLTEAMSFWLNPSVMSNMPDEVNSFLVYIERARDLGVTHGTEFGCYNNPDTFDSVGYDSGYDSQYVYEMWDTYKACADSAVCEGLAN